MTAVSIHPFPFAARRPVTAESTRATPGGQQRRLSIVRSNDEAAPRARRRLEITRRGRLVLTALVFVAALAVAAAAVIGFDVPQAMAGSERDQSVTITVAPGDTLWDYASTYAPSGTDPRDYVLLVERENNLGSERLVAGTSIVLPVGDAAKV